LITDKCMKTFTCFSSHSKNKLHHYVNYITNYDIQEEKKLFSTTSNANNRCIGLIFFLIRGDNFIDHKNNFEQYH